MTEDKPSNHEDNSDDDLQNIMQDVTESNAKIFDKDDQLDQELDDIASKLADSSEEFDLDAGLDGGLPGDKEVDDVIELLEIDDNFDGGLSYDETAADLSDNDFSAQLHHASTNTVAEPPEQEEPPPPQPTSPPEGPEDDDDPILLLDEETDMNMKNSDGGILTFAALVLAILSISIGGYALWQLSSAQAQIATLNTQPQPAPAIDRTAIQAVEQRLDQTEGDLGEIRLQLQKTINQLSNSNGRIQDQLTQIEQLQHRLDSRSLNTANTTAPPPELKRQLKNLETRLQTSEQALRSELKLLASRLESQASTATQTPAPEVAQEENPAIPPQKEAAKASYPQQTTSTSSRPASPWVVNLASFTKKIDALRLRRKLQHHGIFPHIKNVRVKGVNWYRLYVDGFANAKAAQRYANTLKSRPELKQAWAGKAGQ